MGRSESPASMVGSLADWVYGSPSEGDDGSPARSPQKAAPANTEARDVACAARGADRHNAAHSQALDDGKENSHWVMDQGLNFLGDAYGRRAMVLTRNMLMRPATPADILLARHRKAS
ncbi:hypothetical protein CYMTET_23902 [Cymbomonas tetramitiformis]|uniref:Uncharacterized protein n=1 Tax=Cymbomonas tetramitiformis TaxID=36881 RepID=A0AAE0FX63_9CHLO|nr:hypothetical protein CYMTET_23902 [Cymbomonas tetramitiformis]